MYLQGIPKPFLSPCPDAEIFFRLGDKDENIEKTSSVELALGRGMSVEEIVQVYGFDTVSELKEALEDPFSDLGQSQQIWLEADEGHLGAGVYWGGVCCCSSLAELAEYVNSRHWGGSSDVVFVFEGEYLDSCTDGDVAEVHRLLGVLPREVLQNVHAIQKIDAHFGTV